MAIRRGRYGKNQPEIEISEPEEEVPSQVESLLSEEERAEIEAEIVAEIEAEERERLKEQYRIESREKFKRSKGLLEEQITVTIDVAGHAQDIKLDGRPYYHGHTYTVPRSVACTLNDIMGRTWDHEESVGGANNNEYRRPRSTRMLGGRAIQNAPMQNSTAGVQIPVHNQPISDLSKGRLSPRVTTTQNIRG